jgi:type VI protein secretion system component Hcp
LTGISIATPLGIAKADTSDGSGGSSSLDYYLTVDWLDGGVTLEGHEGAFAVEDFIFDIQANTNFTSGSGAAVGKPNPSPLILELKPGAHLNEFVEKITKGTHFTLMRLEGVTSGDSTTTVYDLRLSEVFVTRVTDSYGLSSTAEYTFKQAKPTLTRS